MKDTKTKIGIIGLGYVGLPLAVAFSEHYTTIGFDKDLSRIKELSEGVDRTLEVEMDALADSKNIRFTPDVTELSGCNIFIVTVPTPIDKEKKPNLSALKNASLVISKMLKKDDIVIYESTVFPGATEEICVPILEEHSKLKFNIDFFCGYSPERINPGDKKHRLKDIKKVTSGSTKATAEKIDILYNTIISAGTHKASSIRVAEAAKVIENTQRDINIALINELSLIFKHLDIDTKEVLAAAETKWNFLPFKPGLVGGHCIGVDPYYLTYKALEAGYNPEIILAGRKLNDSMGKKIVSFVTDLMKNNGITIKNSNILVMGYTFKENCPDTRNTRVVDIVEELQSYECNVDVYDPWVSDKQIKEFGIELIDMPFERKYDSIIIAVAHDVFRGMTINEIKKYGRGKCVIYDIKSIFDKKLVNARL